MSDDNVIKMVPKPRKDVVYECGCGCQIFHILENGMVRCYECSLISVNLNVVDNSLDQDEEEN